MVSIWHHWHGFMAIWYQFKLRNGREVEGLDVVWPCGLFVTPQAVERRCVHHGTCLTTLPNTPKPGPLAFKTQRADVNVFSSALSLITPEARCAISVFSNPFEKINKKTPQIITQWKTGRVSRDTPTLHLHLYLLLPLIHSAVYNLMHWKQTLYS